MLLHSLLLVRNCSIQNSLIWEFAQSEIAQLGIRPLEFTDIFHGKKTLVLDNVNELLVVVVDVAVERMRILSASSDVKSRAVCPISVKYNSFYNLQVIVK
uniref:Uncharacterized protein n=1 Tax=Romanomermis culicivorax TaxID=13658 RepID=A0A915IEV7_ROMCU